MLLLLLKENIQLRTRGINNYTFLGDNLKRFFLFGLLTIGYIYIKGEVRICDMDKIKKLLEKEREKLDVLILREGSFSGAVIEQSQKVDNLIAIYMKGLKECSKTGA